MRDSIVRWQSNFYLPKYSSDADRLKRFEQEARATSALNHPNILTVYDIGNHNGSPYIVAELLEGEELRDCLNAGTIPLRKVIDYAQQIVNGLSAAHEKGIVHRDLKPENLFITEGDRIKILDFGLAKLRNSNESLGSEDATRKAITNPGVVMGTVGYMSPEQVRGHIVDYRSDIFSFGAILHEMITGRRAFRRETIAETMTAILKEEPEELTQSSSNISPSLDARPDRQEVFGKKNPSVVFSRHQILVSPSKHCPPPLRQVRIGRKRRSRWRFRQSPNPAVGGIQDGKSHSGSQRWLLSRSPYLCYGASGKCLQASRESSHITIIGTSKSGYGQPMERLDAFWRGPGENGLDGSHPTASGWPLSATRQAIIRCM